MKTTEPPSVSQPSINRTVALLLFGAPLAAVPVFILTHRRITTLSRRIATLESRSRPFDFKHNYYSNRGTVALKNSVEVEPWVGPESSALVDADAASIKCMRSSQAPKASDSPEPKTEPQAVAPKLASLSFPTTQLAARSSKLLADHATKLKDLRSRVGSLQQDLRSVSDASNDKIVSLSAALSKLEDNHASNDEVASLSSWVHRLEGVSDASIARIAALSARLDKLQNHVTDRHTTLFDIAQKVNERLGLHDKRAEATEVKVNQLTAHIDLMADDAGNENIVALSARLAKLEEKHNTSNTDLTARINDSNKPMVEYFDAMYRRLETYTDAEVQRVMNEMYELRSALEKLEKQRRGTNQNQNTADQIVVQRLLVSSLADIATFMYKVELQTGIEAAEHVERVRAYTVKMQSFIVADDGREWR